MEHIMELKALLEEPKRVVITTHQNPDADALGSSLGWAAYLKKRGHQVSVITPTDYPAFLQWMPGEKDVIVYNHQQEVTSNQLVAEAEIIFCLDFNSLKRINQLGKEVQQSKAIKILIDHHLEPEDFALYKFWDVEAAATAEIIYEIIVAMGDESLIDPVIAELLYAGIMTDTGSFKHSNTTQKTHQISGKLISQGAETSKVASLIYDTNSLNRLRFLGYALSEKLTVMPEFKTAYITITQKELEDYHSKTGDTEGLVNYALSIDGIVFAALITDRKDEIKLSFRSIGDFSVNEFARKNFEGGGHKNAAGGVSHQTLEETVKKFTQLLPVYKDKLVNNQMSQTINA